VTHLAPLFANDRLVDQIRIKPHHLVLTGDGILLIAGAVVTGENKEQHHGNKQRPDDLLFGTQ
jgi:hypothetical protein